MKQEIIITESANPGMGYSYSPGDRMTFIKEFECGGGIYARDQRGRVIELFNREFKFLDEDESRNTSREIAIRNAAEMLGDLLIRKNHDYGDSFAQQYAKYGLMSALIRMDDKMRRLETLRGGESAQVSESVSDTLLDLAGYALLSYVEASASQRKLYKDGGES